MHSGGISQALHSAQKKLAMQKVDQVAKPDWRLYGNVQNSGGVPLADNTTRGTNRQENDRAGYR